MTQHFDRFIESDKLVRKSLIIYGSEWQIKGAYIHNESEFRLLSNYFAIGKTYEGQIEIANNYFRGEPDWYFLEGEDGGIDYPATWNFQTLSERKAEFQKFCDHLKELEKQMSNSKS